MELFIPRKSQEMLEIGIIFLSLSPAPLSLHSFLFALSLKNYFLQSYPTPSLQPDHEQELGTLRGLNG